jgi:uncharacterized protein YdhG (YjbR/CyaY superfamily)
MRATSITECLLGSVLRLEKYSKTKAVVSFPAEKPIPKTLVKKLVRASLKDMKDNGKKLI